MKITDLLFFASAAFLIAVLIFLFRDWEAYSHNSTWDDEI